MSTRNYFEYLRERFQDREITDEDVAYWKDIHARIAKEIHNMTDDEYEFVFRRKRDRE